MARGRGARRGELVSPGGARAEVVLPRANGGAGELLGRTAWSACPRLTCAPAIGESEGLGAVALAVAAGRIAAGTTEAALVLGLAQGRGYAIVLARA